MEAKEHYPMGTQEHFRVFHQELLLQKKVRNWNAPKGREGVRGIEATKWPQPYDAKRR